MNNLNEFKKSAGSYTAQQLAVEAEESRQDYVPCSSRRMKRSDGEGTAHNVPSYVPTSIMSKGNEQAEMRWELSSKCVSSSNKIQGQNQRSSSTSVIEKVSIREVRKITGFSGAGTKWFLRYLNEGLTPEQAKQMVLNRTNQKSSDDRRGDVKIRATPSVATKRKTEQKHETRTISASVEKSEIVSEMIRLAILPQFFPGQILSRDEMEQVENALVAEMLKGWVSKIQFDDIHYQLGFILVDCVGMGSANWLRHIVPKLSGWTGATLTTCTGDKIPGVHKIIVQLPQAAGIETGKLMGLIAAQNVGLKTQLWRVTECKDVEDDKLLTIAIDDHSLEVINSNKCMLRYKFGCVPVYKHNNNVASLDTSIGAAVAAKQTAQQISKNETIEKITTSLPNNAEVGLDDLDDLDALDDIDEEMLLSMLTEEDSRKTSSEKE